jgi:hypothetical protein
MSNVQQYSIENVTLIQNDGQQRELKYLIIELSIYEDLFSPTMTGHFTLNDSQGFIETFDISGFNFIKITFGKPGDSYKVDKYFRVYKIGDRKQSTRGNEIYSIYFCSEELFVSEQTKVVKSYKEKQINEIVSDILETYIQFPETSFVDKKYNSKNIEQTSGVYDFIVPNLKPFEAINWLATYAKSAEIIQNKAGADLLFFENNQGFNFKSIQSMMYEDSVGTYHYDPQSLPDQTRDLEYLKTRILAYKFVETFDTLKHVNSGSFANKLIALDPLLRTSTISEFKYDEYFINSISLNSYGLTSDYKNRFGKTVSDTTDAVVKVATSNAQQRNHPLIKNDPAAYATIAPNIDIETYVPYRTAQLALANYTKLEFNIPGDPKLKVGDVVEVLLPSLSNRAPNAPDSIEDPYYSGYYLIAGIRHMLDLRGTYVCVVEAIKDSVTKAHIRYNNNVMKQMRESEC